MFYSVIKNPPHSLELLREHAHSRRDANVSLNVCYSHSGFVRCQGLPGIRGTPGVPGPPGVEVNTFSAVKFMHVNFGIRNRIYNAAFLCYLCQGPRGLDGYKGEQGRPGVSVGRSWKVIMLQHKFETTKKQFCNTSLFFQGERGMPGLPGPPGQRGEKVVMFIFCSNISHAFLLHNTTS